MNRPHHALPLLLACGLAHASPVNFEVSATFSVGSSATAIAAGDMDGDGDIDLVTDSNTGSPNDPLRVHINDGTGQFPTSVVVNAGDGPGNIALGDYDNDGDLDIFHANYFSNDAYLIPNNGDGTFGAPTSYAMGGGCGAVVLGDIDNDKDLDLVGTDHFGGRIRPWRNINGLGFASVGLFPAGSNPFDLALGDVDNDGDLDVVATNEESATISVLHNSGTGTFAAPVTLPCGERPTGVALADLNADGILDVIVAEWGELSPINNTISVRLGGPGGVFGARVPYTVHGRPGTVIVADFDADGTLDIAAACEADDAVAILPGLGDGTFADHLLFDLGVDPRRLAVGDFDGDGDTDIATPGRVLSNITGTPIEPEPVIQAWQAIHDNLFNEDVPSHIVLAPDGGVVSAGATYFSANKDDFYAVKHDADGNLEWTYTYNGPGDHFDRVRSLEKGPGGSIYLSGRSYGLSFGIQWAIAKVDADGSELWVRRYDAGNSIAQQNPLAMGVGADGSAAVTGWARDPDFEVGFMVAAWDAAGNFLWDRKLPSDPDFNGTGYAVAFAPSGAVYAAGIVDDLDEFGDELLLARLNPDGTVAWTRRYDGTTDTTFNTTSGRAIHIDADENVYVAGYTASPGGFSNDFVFLKYDAAGSLLWDRVVLRSGSDTASRITPHPDGSLLVSGSGAGGKLIVAFNESGDQLWSATAPGSVSSDNPEGHLAVTASGVIATIGQLGTDLLLTRFDASGQQLSSSRVDSGYASDFPAAIASGPDESLFLLGQVRTSVLNRRDFAIIKMAPADTPCIADWNTDGSLNFFDVAAYIDAYNTQDPAADIADPPGQFNFFDIAAFIALYNAGCP